MAQVHVDELQTQVEAEPARGARTESPAPSADAAACAARELRERLVRDALRTAAEDYDD